MGGTSDGLDPALIDLRQNRPAARWVCVEKGCGEKVCGEVVASKSSVPSAVAPVGYVSMNATT